MKESEKTEKASQPSRMSAFVAEKHDCAKCLDAKHCPIKAVMTYFTANPKDSIEFRSRFDLFAGEAFSTNLMTASMKIAERPGDTIDIAIQLAYMVGYGVARGAVPERQKVDVMNLLMAEAKMCSRNERDSSIGIREIGPKDINAILKYMEANGEDLPF